MANSDRERAAQPGFRMITMLASSGTAIVAFLGLLGYLPRLRLLTSIRPDYVPMAITTAVCFLVLAAVVFLRARKPSPRPGRLAMEAPAVLVTFFGLLNVAGSIAGMDLNFEDRLVPEIGRLRMFSVGHMSPATGAVFVMAGLGTFLLLLRSRISRHARRLGHWAASLGILTILAGATVLLSYLYGAPLLYSGSTVPMAATTAFAFLLLGNALAAAAGSESFPVRLAVGGSTAARLSRVFLPLTVTVVFLQGILSRIVPIKPGITHAFFLAGLAIAGGTITAILVVRVAHSIGGSLDEASKQLRQSEARAQALLRTIPDMLFRIDRQGVFLDYKADSKDPYAQTEPTLIGKRLRDIVPPAFADLIDLKTRATLETGALQTFEYRLPVPGLGERDYEARMAASGADEVTAIVRDITERKRAEEVIQNSLRFRQALLDAVPSPIFYKDARGLYIGGNKAFERYIGLSPEQFIGKSVYDISPADLAEKYDQADRELLENKGVQTYEASVAAADGTRRDVIFNKAVFTDAKGDVAGLIGVILDITERKRAEKLAEALVGISQAIFTARDLDELYLRIHGYIAGIVPAGNFFIALLADDGQALKFPYYRDEKDASDGEVIQVGDSQSLTVEVLRTKKPLLLDEAKLQDRYATGRNRVWGTAPKCWLGVPLLIRDEVIGVMVIQDYHDGGAYGRKDVALLESTAGQVAIAIARKRTEKALRESEEAFKGYFNMGTVGVCVTSLEKGWIEVNDYMCRMLGYAREELVRLTWAEMTHPDDLNADVALFNQVVAGQRDAYELEKRFIRKDGQTIYALLNATCQRNPDGTVHHFLVSLVDISERKRAEEEIKKQLAEKEILLREVHHRIKNNIAAIGGLISLRLQSVSNPEAAAVLQDAVGRIDSMRILYDKLLLSDSYAGISVKNYLETLIDTIAAIFPDNVEIRVEKHIADFYLDSKKLFPLGIIINELLTNKMKYAFSGRQRGSIRIDLAMADKRARLTIGDDGNTLPPGFDVREAKGFGLMLVKMLSQQLGGSFAIENHAGVRCTVEFNI